MLLSIGKKIKFFFILFSLLILTTFNLNLTNLNLPFLLIKDISFNKTKYLEEEIKFQIYQTLLKTNLIFLNKDNIKKKILLSKWVKEVKFKRLFPDKLHLEIIEFYPIAYFDDNKNIFYLTSNFQIVTKNKTLTDSNLIKVNSYDALSNFKPLFEELKKFENIFSITEEVQMIAPNRWNLLLNNEVFVKLGYENKYKQLQILEKTFVNKKNFTIDLRNINKIYIKDNND